MFFLSGAMGIEVASYLYTDSLLEMESTSGPLQANAVCNQKGIACEGFLPLEAWLPYLCSHPDQRFAAWLKRGILHGFRIGCRRESVLRSCSENMRSVFQNTEVVDKYIGTEVKAGKLMPVSLALEQSIHISPIGIIPKPHQPGKFRLIVYLSSPEACSVNDAIEAELCSVLYASVDQAIQLIKVQGKGCLMAKLDLRSAYRMVPIHRDDQWLLGIKWRDSIFVDKALPFVLPFVLRLAPNLFTAVADGLAWAMYCNGISAVLHYLDDFFFCGQAHSSICEHFLKVAIALCEQLGLPIAMEKFLVHPLLSSS